MKKLTLTAVSLLLAVSALLSACARTGGGADTDGPPQSSAAASDTDAPFTLPLPTLDKNVPDDPADGPSAEYGWLADAMFDTDEELPDYDIPASYIADYTFRQLYSWGDKIYTYTATDTYEGYITVTDKSTYESKPVCTVAGCTHTGDGCESYIYGAVYGFRVYDGMLYWVQGIYDPTSAISLVRCELDGSGRETVWSYDIKSYSKTHSLDLEYFFFTVSGTLSVMIHRGYIYFAGITYASNCAGIGIVCMPLAGGEAQILAGNNELGHTDSGNDSRQKCVKAYRMSAYGNDIYMMVNYKQSVSTDDGFLQHDYAEFYRIDTKTREAYTVGIGVCEGYGQEDYNFDETAMSIVPGDGIYFIELHETVNYLDGNGEKEKTSTATLCRLSFDTGEVERIAKLADGDFDSFFNVGITGNTVEAHSMGNSYIFDLDGNLVSKHELLTEYEYPTVDVIGGGDGDGVVYLSCKADGKRFFAAVPADGDGDIIRFSEYTLDEHDYDSFDNFTGVSEYSEGTYILHTETEELALEYSAKADCFAGTHLAIFFSWDKNNVTKSNFAKYGFPSCGGAVYMITEQGYAETMWETHAQYNAEARTYSHLMMHSCYAEFSFYFGQDEMTSARYLFVN